MESEDEVRIETEAPEVNIKSDFSDELGGRLEFDGEVDFKIEKFINAMLDLWKKLIINMVCKIKTV